MRHFGETFLMVFVIAILASLTLGKLSACAPMTADAKAAAYGVQLAACRADAGTYENYEQCALGVDARFGVKR